MSRGLFLGALLSAALFFAIDVACTPAQRAAAVPALTEAACVLIHGFARSGHADTLCATAEDLAPFVGEIIAEREANPSDVQRGPMLAVAIAELPTPKKRAPPRRRCASWVQIASSSVGDASIEDARSNTDGDP